MSINPNNGFTPFSKTKYNEVVDKLKKEGKRKRIKAGEVILSEGMNCDFFFYVESGCFRAFRYLNEKEINIGFSFRGDLDTCPYSFINDLPSLDTIEALTESTVIIISKSQLHDLEKMNSEIKRFQYFMLSSYIETLVIRSIEFKALNADEIYRNLVERQSREILHIPLKHLASYLGITPERLSRIRKKHPSLT
jgi:CRP/FNR family transcriptional regulator, anaerobic regulatory protein